MAWNTRTDWVTGEAVAASDMSAPGLDVRTWGGNVNGGGYELSNVVIHVENWVTASLQNSWVEFGTDAFGDWAAPAYRKDMSGRVWVRGRAKNGTTSNGTVVFTLPAGYRPPTVLSLVISAAFSGNLPQLVIKPNGECLIYHVTAGTYLDLNVSFSTT